MITTARLTLRPPRLEDIDAFHAIYSDPVAMRHWSRPPHETRGETAELVTRLIAEEAELGPEWAILHEGRVAGRVGLWKRWEFGYIIAPDLWGRGFATEAVRAFLPHAFARHPDCAAITADIDPRNTASARVLEKSGFEVTGHEKNTFCINGEWSDSTYYRLTRPE